MADPVERLRSFIRTYFTRECVPVGKPLASAQTTRDGKSRRRTRSVTGAFNSELLAVISGLVGSLATAFLMGKKN
jgi:hypothetical protein